MLCDVCRSNKLVIVRRGGSGNVPMKTQKSNNSISRLLWSFAYTQLQWQPDPAKMQVFWGGQSRLLVGAWLSIDFFVPPLGVLRIAVGYMNPQAVSVKRFWWRE